MRRIWVLLLGICIAIGYLWWSYTSFYRFIGHARLAAPPHDVQEKLNQDGKDPEIKIVMLGDSLSDGVGVTRYGDGLAVNLALKLADGKKTELVNLARAGATSQDVVKNQLSEAVRTKADITTVLIGVNDIHNLVPLDEFEKNYREIISNLKNNSGEVIVMTIPNLGSNKILVFPYNLISDMRTRQFNQIIQKVAGETGVRIVDLYRVKKDSDFYAEDEFHPNKNGYALWVKQF